MKTLLKIKMTTNQHDHLQADLFIDRIHTCFRLLTYFHVDFTEEIISQKGEKCLNPNKTLENYSNEPCDGSTLPWGTNHHLHYHFRAAADLHYSQVIQLSIYSQTAYWWRGNTTWCCTSDGLWQRTLTRYGVQSCPKYPHLQYFWLQ